MTDRIDLLVSCSPVTVVGGSETCGGNQALCCTDNNYVSVLSTCQTLV